MGILYNAEFSSLCSVSFGVIAAVNSCLYLVFRDEKFNDTR